MMPGDTILARVDELYRKMAVYLVFFVMGFLTDKIRLFPLILGVLLGIVLKTMVENVSIQNIPMFGTQMYHKAMDLVNKHQFTCPSARTEHTHTT